MRGYYHKNSKIRVEPPSHVSMYITQITPLEYGEYEGEETITKAPLLSQLKQGIQSRTREMSHGTTNHASIIYHTNP